MFQSCLHLSQTHEDSTCCLKIDDIFLYLLDRETNIKYVTYIFPIACILILLMTRTCWLNAIYSALVLQTFFSKDLPDLFLCIWFGISSLPLIFFIFLLVITTSLVRLITNLPLFAKMIMLPLHCCSKNHHPLNSS